MDRDKVLSAARAMSVQGTNIRALYESPAIVRQTLYRFIVPTGELREAALKLFAEDTA